MHKADTAMVIQCVSFIKEVKTANKRIPPYEVGFSKLLTPQGIGWCNNSWLRLVD